jgi:hypothetical protein
MNKQTQAMVAGWVRSMGEEKAARFLSRTIQVSLPVARSLIAEALSV